MSEWAAKRFWKDTAVEPVSDGYTVALDGRRIKTPAKADLILPTSELAEAVQAEWAVVDEKINPETMPFTRSANAAIDKVMPQFDEVVKLVAAYADSDLLCYRADSPAELRSRQDEAWDRLLNWVKEAFGLQMDVTEGVMHSAQVPETIQRAEQLTGEMSAYQLTAFHDLVGLSGSFVIGLAATKGHETPENLWKTSRIDELWQQELWGEDEEAVKADAVKEKAFVHAARLFELSASR